jgi:acyl-CoA thioesterase
VRFEEASKISGGSGSWTAQFAEGWDVLGTTNGGYALGVATKAMAAEAGGRRLISTTAVFVNRSEPGPVQISVETLKEGRSTTALRATVSRGDTGLFHATGIYAEGDMMDEGRDILAGDPPELPAPDESYALAPIEGMPFPPEFSKMVDVRLHPEDAAAFLGRHAPLPSFRGWFRLRDAEPLDANAVVMATDSFPPAIFNSDYSPGWTPTVELSIQVRQPNPTGWLACRFATRFVTGGMLEEDGEVWDESGRLVALSRQLALVPRQGAT